MCATCIKRHKREHIHNIKRWYFLFVYFLVRALEFFPQTNECSLMCSGGGGARSCLAHITFSIYENLVRGDCIEKAHRAVKTHNEWHISHTHTHMWIFVHSGFCDLRRRGGGGTSPILCLRSLSAILQKKFLKISQFYFCVHVHCASKKD